MASSSLSAASSNSCCIPSNLLAAVVTFEHKCCSGPPDRAIERYCQARKHGGGDVSTVIYPWKGDQDQALVIFEEEFACKDVVHTLASKKQPPITNIVEFVESQCFGCVTTCVSPALLEKLLTQYTVEKIVSRLELETGIKVTFEESQNRLSIKGFYFQIKLAEEALNKLKDEIGSSSQQAEPDSSEDLEAEPTVASPDQSISGGETPSDELRPALKTSAPPFSGLNSPSSVIGPLDSSGGVVSALDELIDDVTSPAESTVDNPLVVPNTDYASLTAPADDPNLPALTDDPHLATVLDNSRASDITIDQDSSASTDNAKPTVPPHDPSFTTPVVSPKSHVDDSHSSDSTVDRDAPAENTNSSINTDDPSFTSVDDSNSSAVLDNSRFVPVVDNSHSFNSTVNQDSSTPTNNSKPLEPSDPSVSTPADDLNSSVKVDVVTDESNLPDSEVASGPAAPGDRPNSSTYTDARLAALVDEPQSFDPTADDNSSAATDDPKSSTPPDDSRSASQTVDQGAANNTNSIPIGDQSSTDPASTVSGTAASSDNPSAEAESLQTNSTESEQDQESSNKKVNDSEESKQFNAFNPSNRRIIPSLPDAFVLSAGSKEGSAEPVDHRENLKPEPSDLLPEESRSAELEKDNITEVVTTSPWTPSTTAPVTSTTSSGAVAVSSDVEARKPKSAPASILKSTAARVRAGSTPTSTGEEPEVTTFRATVTTASSVTSTSFASTTTTTSTTPISSAPPTSKSAEGPSVPAEPAPNSSSTDNSNLESTVGAKGTGKEKLSVAESQKKPLANQEEERLSLEKEGDPEAANSERQDSAGDSTKMSGEGKSSKALKVEEDFDKIYYEFMRIIRVRDFQARILEKYGGQLHEKEHPTDSRLIRIQITSHTPGEAAKMMHALNEMFYEINRSVHSHSTKLLYDGDKDKLAEALMKDIRDPSLGFIARLVTKEDIRIIGSIANMDRDVSIVESYIGGYKNKYPAAPVTKVTQSDIALPNGTVVTVIEGDLTKVKCDAVVSSSGPDLAHKRGVSKAIAQACGQRFSAKGRQFIKTGGELKDGDIFVQPADGRMAVKGVRYIIHAIAPLPSKTGDITPLLVKTVWNALKEADSLKCRTVALPAICSGNMGVPLQTCAECYWTALVKYSTENPLPKIKQILFVVDDPVMVLQIHQVMSSKSFGGTAVSSGGTAASSGGAAASSGGTASSSGGQETASGQRKGSSGKRGGRTGAANVVGKEDWDEELAVEKSKEAATKRTPGSVGVEGRGTAEESTWGDMAHGLIETVSGFVPTFLGGSSDGSSASVDKTYGNQQGHSSEADTDHPATGHRAPGSKDHSSSRRDSSIAEVHGDEVRTTNLLGAKDPYFPRANPATSTAAARVSAGSAANIPGGTAAAAGTTKPNDKECPICMDDFKDPVALPCSHKFCRVCVDQLVKTAKSNLCPTCRTPFRNAEGKQPIGGTMATSHSRIRLPGYPRDESIFILYTIPGGIQGPEHPNPGQRYTGTSRKAYLPDNTKGRRAEKLLRKAFNQRLVFTIGQSVTTGLDNCVVWNDIHHKTNISGGPSNYGYPDPDYLDRLIEDLKAKGITD